MSWLITKEFALHVLFVCTGNICRSPTAERLAAMCGALLKIPNFQTSSAGTRAVIAHPIHHEAALVLDELGGDATSFAARQLTAKIASSADLIVTMTKAHRDSVLEIAPHKLHKTFTLIEAARLADECNPQTVADLSVLRSQLLARDTLDIPDPIGQSDAVFARIGAQIADLLPPVVELCRRSSV